MQWLPSFALHAALATFMIHMGALLTGTNADATSWELTSA